MKTTLIFESDGSDEFDKYELNRIIHATDAYLVLFDICNYLRGCKKQDISDEVYDVIEEVHKHVYEAMEDNNITMDDLP